MEIPLDTIKIGTRHRHDMGDIAGLARSIKEVGLLHPIVVAPDNTLIAGERRLAAMRSLGFKEVPVSVVDLAEIVRGEFAENMARKDFLPSEAVAIKRALEPVAIAEAEGRMKAGAPLPKLDKGRSTDKVAAYTGIGRTTLDKADALVAAAEAEPEKFSKLVADMDRTGRVDGPYKRLVVARKAEAIKKEPPGLPGKGPYRVIAADPPWPYEHPAIGSTDQ